MLAIAYHFAGAILAPTAAAADRQLHLHIAQSARALLDSATNLAIGDAMANADVHGEFGPAGLVPMLKDDPVRLHANANDCQCDVP
jgi:hypothetical protein